MKIKKLTSSLSDISNIILYTETSKDDYLFNHQLSIVNDSDIKNEMLTLYDKFPDETIVSDRKCFIHVISIQRGYYE